jgi:hypothetical protein
MTWITRRHGLLSKSQPDVRPDVWKTLLPSWDPSDPATETLAELLTRFMVAHTETIHLEAAAANMDRRVEFLRQVVEMVAGSYLPAGVPRWFERTRSQLSGRAPAELLVDDWTPDDEGPQQVYALAATLGAPLAT